MICSNVFCFAYRFDAFLSELEMEETKLLLVHVMASISSYLSHLILGEDMEHVMDWDRQFEIRSEELLHFIAAGFQMENEK
jgi:hypothetical protein